MLCSQEGPAAWCTVIYQKGHWSCSVIQVARDEKLSTQHREHEARMARALERAAAPVFKKTGKPLMFRSAPPQRKKVVQADDRNDEEAELEAYLAQDMI